MKTVKNFLPSVLAAVLLTMLGAGSAQAEDSGGYGNSGYSDFNNNCGGSSYFGSSLQVIGLTSDQRLICFNEFNPGEAKTIDTVTGFSGDTKLVGIDFRVQDKSLYGVGDKGGVYKISTNDAFAQKVSQLTVPLNGAFFGVDFNPAADRLRVISNTGQNLRHNVNAGGTTIVDGTLSYTAPATTTALGVTGSAYTNNDLDLNTATTLYALDSTLDQVAIQSPANNGTLQATGKLTVNTTPSVGFDIYSTIRNGTTVNIEGFTSLTSSDDRVVRFYSVRLFSGKATSRGSFSSQDEVG
ncbi:DUF4394 domain-containing protein [Methyloglobulus sp.]|uniref:DUF4394 domain-containing protein n=1 Tax=Methyloglobulus sp. TaxID=2518622 RepID=UPI00398A3A95